MNKNGNDVWFLQKLITEQNAKGAELPEDLDHRRYKWDDDGHLVGLRLGNCGLTGEISFDGLGSLKVLFCGHSQLTSIDVGNNVEIEQLDCSYSNLTSLDVSRCPGLKKLDASYNQLPELDISANTKLEGLYCKSNRLEHLKLPETGEDFVYLYCEDNLLTGLDLNGLDRLKDLRCNNNQLTSLDVSGCPVLAHLYCGNNQIRALNVESCPNLGVLVCHNNPLESLDIRGVNLKYVDTVCPINRQLDSDLDEPEL